MVKVNELRVGNWIADHEAGGYFQVESIYKNAIGVYRASYRKGSIKCAIDELEEIPLTEEWLVKLGFEFWCDELGIKAFYKNYGIEYLCYATNGFWQIRSGLKTHDACWRMHNYPFLKYVHQLQNIYFALTGEELKIKGGNNE